MAGLISTKKEPDDAGMKESSNPGLEKIEAGIEAKIPPQFRKAYLAVVVAGNKVLFSDQTKDKTLQAAQQPDFIQKIPAEVSQVISFVRDNSGKDQQGQPLMNSEAASPAGVTLAVHLLGFSEQVTGTKITPDVAMSTIRSTAQAIDQAMSLTAQPAQPNAAQPPGQPPAQAPVAPQTQPMGA